jgi:DNA-binding PadR family transcriptional regulator
MSIKYAVLGLIAEEPRHGYAVRAEFEARLGDFWELNYGQVYQVLTALEQEGLIVGSDERVGRRPTRKVYAISAKGREALRRWLEQPLSRKQPFRDEFYVRLLFAGQADPKLVPRMVETQIKRCNERLAELLDQPGREGLGEPADPQRLFRQAAILHAEADLKALALCREVLIGEGARGRKDAPVTVRVGRVSSGR